MRSNENIQINLGCFSLVALAVSIFFLLGSFFGVDESTKDTLPIIYGISAIAGVIFVVLMITVVVLRIVNKKREKERLEKERLEKERLEKERLEKERLEKERLEKERLKRELLKKERLQKKEKELLEKAQKKEQLEQEQQKALEILADEIKGDYIEVFNKVDHDGIECFEKELKKLDSKYKKQIGEERLHKFLHDVTKDWYFEGNNIVCQVLIRQMFLYLRRNMMKPDGDFNEIDVCYIIAKIQASAITSRALHFEKNGQKQREYKSITEDICREYLSKINSVSTDLANKTKRYDLFKSNVNTAKATVRYSETVNTPTWLDDIYQPWYLPNTKSESYYADSLCNVYWKTVTEAQGKEASLEPNDVFSMIYVEMIPTDKECHMIEKAIENKKIEKQARELELKIAIQRRQLQWEVEEQCRTCIRKDHCGQFGKRANCSAYIPQ